MIGAYSPQLEAEGRFMSYGTRFADLSDSELLEMYNRLALKHRENKPPKSYSFIPDEWHQARAAIDLLRERNGEEYVENLTGVKQPKTLVGKLIRFFI